MTEIIQKYSNVCMHGVTLSVSHHLMHGVTGLFICISIPKHVSTNSKNYSEFNPITLRTAKTQ